MKNKILWLVAGLTVLTFGSCKDNDADKVVDKPNTKPDWYYTGGRLGTTYLNTMDCFQQPMVFRYALMVVVLLL